MRSTALACALVAGCSFQPRAASSEAIDARNDDASAGDAEPMGDAPPPQTTFVRRIVIEDLVVDGPHEQFPVALVLTGGWLGHGSGDIGHPMGYDIVFSEDQAGTARLAHEIEYYANEDLVVWVKVPQLSAGTTFYMHYGDANATASSEDAAGVWSNAFAGVWHMNGVADSTGLNPNSADGGTADSAGRVGRARDFAQAGDFIDAGSAPAIDNLFATRATAEAWFLAETWGGNSHGRLFDKGHNAGWSIGVNDVEQREAIYLLQGSSSSTIGFWNSDPMTVDLGEWTHVAMVYDQGALAIYLDGVAAVVDRFNAPVAPIDDDSGRILYIGNWASKNLTFDGQLDEMRLSNTTRSAGWIQTAFRNQNAPDDFYKISAPL